MSQHVRSISNEKMTISTKLFPPLESFDQPLPSSAILLDNNDNVADYDRERMTSSWSMHSNWSSIQQDDGRASSLDSWGEDEFDRQAARRVLDLFADIDLALYEEKRLDNPLLDAECADWRATFPHLRVTGRRIRPQSRSITPLRPPSVTLTSSQNRKKKKKKKHRSSLPSTSKQVDEIFAQHGTLDDLQEIAPSQSKQTNSRQQDSDIQIAIVVQDLTARHLWPNVLTTASPLIDAYKTEIIPTIRSLSPIKRHSVPNLLIPEKVTGRARRNTQTTSVTFLSSGRSALQSRRVQSVDAPKQRPVRKAIASNSRMISAVKLQPRKLRPIGAANIMKTRNQEADKSWSKLPPIDSSRSPRVQLGRPTSAHTGRVQFKVSGKNERARTFEDVRDTNTANQVVHNELPQSSTSGKLRKGRISRKDALREIPKHTAQRASSKAARKSTARPSVSASPMKRSVGRLKSPFRI